MAVVSTIALNMVARTSAFDRNVKKSRKNVRNFRSTTAGGIKTIGKFATGLIAAAGIGGMGLWVKNSMAAIDVTAKLSDRLKIATEDIIGMRHAAEIMGASAEGMDKSLEMFVRRLGEVRQGTGEAKRALEELGLDVNKLITLSPAEAFRQIADEIKGMEFQADKAAAAYQLFGRQGVKLLNTLELGSVGLDKMQKDAERLGLTFSRFDAAKVEEANDSILRLRRVMTGIGQTLAIELAPVLAVVAEDITNMATRGEGLTSNVSAGFVKIAKAAAAVGRVLDGIKATLNGIIGGIQRVIELTLKPFRIRGLADDFGAASATNLQQSRDQFENAFFGGGSVDKFADKVRSKVAAIKNSLIKPGGESFISKATKEAEKFERKIETLLNTLKTPKEKMAEFTAVIQQALDQSLINIEQFTKLANMEFNKLFEVDKIKSFAQGVLQSLKAPTELLDDFKAKIKEAQEKGFLSPAKAAEAIIKKSQELFEKLGTAGTETAAGPVSRGQSQEVRTAFVNVAALSAGGQDSVIKEQQKTTEELQKQTNLLREIASQEIR